MAARMSMLRFPSIIACGRLIKQECRSLYSAASLGMDGFVNQRENYEARFKDINNDKFRDRMKEQLSEPTNLVFTEDLKTMVHLVKNDAQDVEIISTMLKKFNTQKKTLRFGTFVFGPVVMRMFYFLGKPEVAFEMLKDPDLQSFFDQISSYLILMDSFYKQGKYERVLDVFEQLQDRQLFGTKYPKDCVVLVLAACFKLNTKESFDFVINLLEGTKETGSGIMRRGITLAAALALKQNNPGYALEILSLANQVNYFTIRNLMMIALSELDRIDEVFLILNALAESDNPELKGMRGNLFRSTYEKIKSAVERSGSKEKIAELMRLEKALSDAGRICNDSLDSVLLTEITPKQDLPMYRQRRRENLNDNQMRSRKGLRDMVDY